MKPPETKTQCGAEAFIVRNQFAAAGGSVMRWPEPVRSRFLGQPLQQRHPFQSAPSKSSSPFIARAVMSRTCAPTPGFLGEFVDAFLLDHGAVHVGQKHLLAPSFGGQNTRSTPMPRNFARVGSVAGQDGEGNSAASSGAQPGRVAPAPGVAKDCRQGRDQARRGAAISVAMNMEAGFRSWSGLVVNFAPENRRYSDISALAKGREGRKAVRGTPLPNEGRLSGRIVS